MKLIRYSNPRQFQKATSDLLLAREAVHCVLIGVLESLIHDPGRYSEFHLAAIQKHDRIIAVFLMTPPHPFHMTAIPEQAWPLVIDYAQQLPDPISGAAGPEDTAPRFAELWREQSGAQVSQVMRQGIYQLQEVTFPVPPGGDMRQAQFDDFEWLVAWDKGFCIDARIPQQLPKVEESLRRALDQRRSFLWVVKNEPVAMARVVGATPSGSRMGGVYTPRELRRRGYATELMACLSRKILEDGKKFCFLYTDLDNPTSNSIYQKVGYRPVCNAQQCHFDPGTS